MEDEIGRVIVENKEAIILQAPSAGLSRDVEVIGGIEGGMFVVLSQEMVESYQKREDGPRLLIALATQAVFDYLYYDIK